MKRHYALALVSTALVVAAASGAAAAKSHPQATSRNEPTLVVANWEDYGSDEPWAVKYFEQKYHCIIKPVYFNSETQALSLLQNGGLGHIDVILPNLAYVRQAVSEGLLQPINTSKLSNYNQLYPTLRTNPYDRVGGKVYGIPWTWGTTGLAYNPQLIKTPLNSWAALWNPKYKGEIGFFDDPTTAIMTTALYLHENPYHPNLAKVKAALLKQKALDKLYWSSQNDWDKAYTSKEIALGNVWSGAATALIASGTKMTYVLPKEGAIGWVDNWAIAKDAPHLQLAYDWINYMISVQFQSHYARDLTAEPPAMANSQVNKHLPQSVIDATFSFPQWLHRLVIQRALPAGVLNTWTQLWEQVKGQ
jgi:spermidine/putrescine transport system substrate-binding protein